MARLQHFPSVLPTGSRKADHENDPNSRIRAVANSRDREKLGRALRDSSPEVARAAIARLIELDGALALPTLRQALLEVDVALVEGVAKALRSLHDPEVVDLALKARCQEPYTRRLAATITLGVMGDTSVVANLRTTLSDPIAAVRERGLQALTRLGPDDDTLTKATGLLEDPSAEVRIAAVCLVAGYHAQPASALAGMAADCDLRVRRELARHLRRLPKADAHRLLVDHVDVVRCEAARNAGSEHLHLLGELLASDTAPRYGVSPRGRSEGSAATMPARRSSPASRTKTRSCERLQYPLLSARLRALERTHDWQTSWTPGTHSGDASASMR